ncbi:MAG: 5'/3'-nucleotidase SurE [Gemmatimonadetes bacterium]|nr:5'/3'-nucleotidase SurE [Gemmatimonadota bacterium]
MDRLLLLATNDDGYLARGLQALVTALEPLGDVWVVAPDREQSATSHSLTLHHPLRVVTHGERRFHVDGSPTDCVLLAVHGDLLPRRPDYIFSGINHGGNMGEDVSYSGTVAAAMEGTILGIPSVAISLVGGDAELLEGYAATVGGIAREIVTTPQSESFPEDTLLNINLPPIAAGGIRGIRIAPLGKRVYENPVLVSKDPRGKTYYWIGGEGPTWRGEEDSDFRQVEEGYIAITPLHLDLTNYKTLQDLRKWEGLHPLGTPAEER